MGKNCERTFILFMCFYLFVNTFYLLVFYFVFFYSFVRSFVCLLLCISGFVWLSGNFFIPVLVCLFGYFLVRLDVYSFARSFVRCFVPSYVCLLFVYLFVCFLLVSLLSVFCIECNPFFNNHCFFDTEESKCHPVNPCQNNGLCKEDLSGYKCLCPENFSGMNCEGIYMLFFQAEAWLYCMN